MTQVESRIGSFASPSRENPVLRGLKAVSEETRLRILHILSYGDFSVNEIVEILQVSQSTVSRHLRILTDAGILSSHREGSWVYYGFRVDKSPFSSGLLEFLLGQREDLPFREVDQKNLVRVLEKRDRISRSFFDDLGQNWEKVQEEVLDPKIYRDRLIQALPPSSRLILDLGCGPGGLIPFLLNKAEKVLGVDSSSGMVETCRKAFRGNQRVEIREAHLEHLPIPRSKADSVVASMVLHHLSHPPRVFQQVNRVLKIGGTFAIVDLLKHDQEFMRERYADLWLGFEPELLRSWLFNHGFRIEEEDILPTKSVFKILFFKATKKEDIHVPNSNENQ